jgi:3-isopropylmalate dehydratase small subunit
MSEGEATQTVLRGRAHLLPEEINTDVHCSAKYLPGKDTGYVAQHAFEGIAPGFAARFNPGGIIVAGRNFGINSSREQAVHAMRIMGVAAVVAPAFGRQFFRNAMNNGLPLVECDIGSIDDGDELELNLAGGVLAVRARGVERAFTPLPLAMQSLLQAGGLIPFLQAHPDWKLS